MKNNTLNTLLIILTCICLILLVYIGWTGHKNTVLGNNIKALMDTVGVLEMKNGDLVYERQALMLEKKELEKYLDISKKDFNELEKRLKSKIDYIAKLEGNVRIDTLTMTDSVYVMGDTINADFIYKDEFTDLAGTTTIIDTTATTSIDHISMRVPLTVGVTEQNQIFVRSHNPNVVFTDIQGAQLQTKNTKPKRWNIGIQAGFGVQYDVIGRRIGVGPYIGGGISYGFDF